MRKRPRLFAALGVAIGVVVASFAGAALSRSPAESCGAGEARSETGFTYGSSADGGTSFDSSESAHAVALTALIWARGTPDSAESKASLEASIPPDAVDRLAAEIQGAKYTDGGVTLSIDEAIAADGRTYPSITVGQASDGTYSLGSISYCVSIEDQATG
ncbi:MAG: hypothetical protein WD096_06140 [Actinomycetota bacterium]